jgi:hypothetical protein
MRVISERCYLQWHDPRKSKQRNPRQLFQLLLLCSIGGGGWEHLAALHRHKLNSINSAKKWRVGGKRHKYRHKYTLANNLPICANSSKRIGFQTKNLWDSIIVNQ